MAEQNKIKPDTILKNFWRDNDRFADLFNTALFGGKKVLDPASLTEVDTDVSNSLKINGHAETVQRVLDVVKKNSFGIEFAIFGIENQQKIHYAMPLRHMIGDAFSYLKEYQEIAASNNSSRDYASSDEFLSRFKKTDKLHPVVTLCLYYGETPWDGPLCLADMLHIPEEIRPLVSDYKMNLLQLRDSQNLQFQNRDVKIVFDVSNSIYQKKFDRIMEAYGQQDLPAELGIVIGAITESQDLIDHAVESEGKGGKINMCTALEEFKQESKQEGLREGLEKGAVKGSLETCKDLGLSLEDAMKLIKKKFNLPEEEVQRYVKEYWID